MAYDGAVESWMHRLRQAGHETVGIGPGFGEVVAHMGQGREPEYPLERFRFSRFSDGSRLELGTAL